MRETPCVTVEKQIDGGNDLQCADLVLNIKCWNSQFIVESLNGGLGTAELWGRSSGLQEVFFTQSSLMDAFRKCEFSISQLSFFLVFPQFTGSSSL